jgi:Flp pilus assembly protein TadD
MATKRSCILPEGFQARLAISAAASRLVALTLVSLLTACASTVPQSPDLGTLEPLHYGAVDVSVAEAEALAPTPDLLALTDEMREFVDSYVLTARSQRQRLHMLHSSLRSNALLGLDYDPAADGTAAQAFDRGVANCLSFAHLFISMARYAGLDARYQRMTLRPQWTRYGTRVALRQHVNVLVRLSRSEHYMVDIDPVQRDSVANTRMLDDSEAFALHHNNLAMNQLRLEQLEGAYAHAIKAVSLSPATDYLWVNLGVVYSRAGQAEAARHSYLAAIGLNADSRSAMNNLVVLHTREGEPERAAFWERQVVEHRQRNPYYYIYLGEEAEKAGDFKAAIAHYKSAIKRKSSDAEFYFRLGKLYFALEQPGRSIYYLEKAIERSSVVGEREEYQAFLERIEAPSLAQL